MALSAEADVTTLGRRVNDLRACTSYGRKNLYNDGSINVYEVYQQKKTNAKCAAQPIVRITDTMRVARISLQNQTSKAYPSEFL
jgi:phosphotransacetylase